MVPETAAPLPREVMLTEGGAEVTPVPERARVPGELGALLARDKLPETLPAVVGAKATLKLELCPGDRVKGRVRPLTEKPPLGTVSWETVKLAVPELVSLLVGRLVVFSATYEKLTLAGTSVICGDVEAPELTTETPNSWLAAPLQVFCSKLAPDAVEAPMTSTHPLVKFADRIW